MALVDTALAPALQKMEGNTNRKTMRSRRRFNVGNIIGDPFALATISISVLAWLIAFVSSVIAEVDHNKSYPNFAWWTIVYMFFCILGVTVVIASDSVHTYHVAIVGFLAAGMTFTTSAANQLIYSAAGSMEAAAAGYILLSMITIVWIFYFGSQPQASHRAFLDSFALNKGDKASSRGSRQMSNRYLDQQASAYHQGTAPQIYSSNQLNGFEASSPNGGYPQGQNGLDSRSSRFGGPTASSQILHTGGGPGNSSMVVGGDSEASAPTEYPYRARAIYSYEANLDDVNEISFAKHEILEVSDVSGRWWQAKKSTGETGIAPSNYLILL